jgi:predicted TIM-barrel fold metal-dependent hydrolase
MDVVDAHCHIISPDTARYPCAPIGGTQSGWAVSRPVSAEQMLAGMDRTGIAAAVLVQATTNYGYDNAYVLDSFREHPERFVAVGTFDPLRPDAPQALQAAIEQDGLAGVRLFTSGSTVPEQGEWFAAPESFAFWQRAQDLDVPVCLQMRLGPATARLEDLLGRFPGVRVLLDHLGYPDIAGSPQAAGQEVAGLGRHQRLHLKLTHRNLERLQDAGAQAREFLDPVIEAFGADRIAWGSNCPAAEQSLPQLLQLAQDVLASRPASEQEQILGGTALALYPALAGAESGSGSGDTPARLGSASGPIGRSA